MRGFLDSKQKRFTHSQQSILCLYLRTIYNMLDDNCTMHNRSNNVPQSFSVSSATQMEAMESSHKPSVARHSIYKGDICGVSAIPGRSSFSVILCFRCQECVAKRTNKWQQAQANTNLGKTGGRGKKVVAMPAKDDNNRNGPSGGNGRPLCHCGYASTRSLIFLFDEEDDQLPAGYGASLDSVLSLLQVSVLRLDCAFCAH